MWTSRGWRSVAVLVIGLAGWATSPRAADRSAAAVTKHYIELSGGQLHYVTAGDGEPVLLLHQAPLSHVEFLDTIPLLARHFRVIAWDAPGHGSSYIPAREYQVPDYLGVLDEFVSALGLSRIHIVGNHAGAALAREYAATYPEKTGKIILSGSARQPPDPKTKLARAEEFLSQPYSRELTLTREGEFLPPSWRRYVALASPQTSLEDVLTVFLVGLEARTKPYDMHLAVFRYDGWSDYRTVQAPTLLLSGADDFFVNQERLDYTCTLFPVCTVHPLISDAGAFIGTEQPEAYAQAITEFLLAP